jgi:hypothetical protein
MPMLETLKPTEVVAFKRLLQVRPHHLRSVQLERDFPDPGSTLHYVVTPFVRATVERLLQSFEDGTTARAWRLTGDYGSGKSSFALALARLAAGQTFALPAVLQPLAPQVRLEPVIVVGEREPIGRSVLRALRTTLQRCLKRVPRRLETLLVNTADVEPTSVMVALDATANALRSVDFADGLLLILDELGKNLEFGAQRAGSDDVYLLQHLAETAARSGERPFVVVAVLHQAVAAYAASLPSAERREWEKVAGRYEEVVFAPPLEQTATLVAAALDVDQASVPLSLTRAAGETMAAGVDLGWFGPGVAREPLIALAPALLPLDPLLLPPLTRLLRRFGQNERSLFSFLSSSEPHGLMAHAGAAIDTIAPYRIHNLYDYVSANLTSVLETGHHSTRWSVINGVVRSALVDDEVELSVLKTVGLLNLLDDPGLAATPAVVSLAVAGTDRERQADVNRALARLTNTMRLLYDRGHAGGLCLWPNTSVDLDDAFAKAVQTLGGSATVVDAVGALLSPAPLVARRHYVETGALRHFEPTYTSLRDLEAVMAKNTSADGRIIVVLCETPAEHAGALKRALKASAKLAPTDLVGVPNPVGGLAPLLRDARAWSWVRDHTPALAGDRLARDEVTRQLALAQDRLSRALAELVDLRGGDPLSVRWFHCGKPLAVESGRALTAHLSKICDEEFDLSPIVRNELINRQALSSAAARARYLLVEALANGPHQPRLGLSDHGTPPELAVYLSVLHRGRVHVQCDGGWRVEVPAERDDPLRLCPSLMALGDKLRAAEGGRVPYAELADAIRGGRYGVREGLVPLLIAIYVSAHWHSTAVYEEGSYLDQVGGPEFNRIVKEPEHFAFQHCAIEGIRAGVFARLAQAIGVERSAEQLDLLDVVRPLVQFVARLPDHARRTRRLSARTVAIRTALVGAQDPTSLVFEELPAACDLEPIDETATLDPDTVDRFVQTVEIAIRELRDCYSTLLERVAQVIGAALDLSGSLGEIRAVAMTRAAHALPAVIEPELKAFLMRLGDTSLPDRAWIESLASLVAKKPPERWADPDESEFEHRLPQLVRRFRRVEATLFEGSPDNKIADHATAYRLVVTAGDGREVEEVLRASEQDGPTLKRLERELGALLQRHGRLGALAAARALMTSISQSEADEDA